MRKLVETRQTFHDSAKPSTVPAVPAFPAYDSVNGNNYRYQKELYGRLNSSIFTNMIQVVEMQNLGGDGNG